MATTAGTSYQQLLDAVENYYGSGSDQWVEVARYGLRADNMAEILRQVPGVQAHVNKAGEVIGYTISESVPVSDGGLSLPAINSNVQTGTAAANNTTQIQTLGNFTSDAQTGDVSSTNQIPKKTGGVLGTAAAVVGTVAATTMAAGVGLKLGRWINNELYENNPDFWRDITNTPDGSEAQAEWARITAAYDEIDKDGKVTNFLNVIAGLSGKESTAYIDENALAYYAWQLKNSDFFSSGSVEREVPTIVDNKYTVTHGIDPITAYTALMPMWALLGNNPFALHNIDLGSYIPLIQNVISGISVGDYAWSAKAYQGNGSIVGMPINVAYDLNSPSTNTDIGSDGFNIYTRSGAVIIYLSSQRVDGVWQPRVTILTNQSSYAPVPQNTVASYGTYGSSSNFRDFSALRPEDVVTAGTTYYGVCVIGLGGALASALPGVDTDPTATLPNTSGWDTPADVLASLKNQYPSWWDDAYINDVIGEDGIPRTVNYIPIPLPAGYTNNNPTTQDNPSTQQNPAVNPDNPSVTDDLLRTIIAILSKPAVDPATITDPKTDDPTGNETNPPDTGGGVTPPLVVPVGSASALWAVYNPTQAQIDSLGAWLWSNNFVDQLLKMFNDPMQAIIGLHKTFIPPITGGVQDIKVGYLNSGVSALTVPVQYSSVDCGTINCAEYFGNVFDYSPYTRIYLYLPFIGFKELEVAQVMRSRINVTYHGDAFTGTCLAEVAVNRDGESGGVLYTYSGDCAARYPLSHGSYMGIVNAIAGIGIGIGTALAGAPSIGIAGAVGMAQHARATVEHSGSFSGNSGAMGIKRPYLVIMRPQTAMARNYEHFTGQPSNSNVVLGSATGYVRVKECHVEDIATATDAEKQMIESALKIGVII